MKKKQSDEQARLCLSTFMPVQQCEYNSSRFSTWHILMRQLAVARTAVILPNLVSRWADITCVNSVIFIIHFLFCIPQFWSYNVLACMWITEKKRVLLLCSVGFFRPLYERFVYTSFIIRYFPSNVNLVIKSIIQILIWRSCFWIIGCLESSYRVIVILVN